MFALEVPVVFLLAMLLALAGPAPAVTPSPVDLPRLGRIARHEVPVPALPGARAEEEEPTPAPGPEVEAPPELAPLEPLPAALASWPDNEALVNPFGRGTALACDGLMKWLAPRQRGRRWHSGLDLVPARGRAQGRKLYSPGTGYVLARRDGHPAWGSYLVIAYRQGTHLYLTAWFHLQWGSHEHLAVRDMDADVSGQVLQGDFLGRVGATGAARGAHLHLDVLEVDPALPDELPRNPWRGREWSQVRHPGEVIPALPDATWQGRERPGSGLLTRAVRTVRES